MRGARIFRYAVGAVLAAALSGCGVVPVWFAGTYYGPAPRGGEVPAPPRREPVRVAAEPDAAAKDEAAAGAAMDRAYRALAAGMTLQQQVALSTEQTVWLNQRDFDCGQTGAISARCDAAMMRVRTAVFEERLSARAAAGPVVAAAPRPAAARSATLRVAGTAMPWVWKAGGLNAPFAFGYQDGTAPAALDLAGLGVGPGGAVTIRYVGGQITLGPGTPATDGLGYAGLSAQKGPVGKYPSAYMRAGAASLGALVGVFTRPDGRIVGAPFGVGDGPARVAVPAGAARLQLGINDDIYGGEAPGSGNAGALTVRVSGD